MNIFEISNYNIYNLSDNLIGSQANLNNNVSYPLLGSYTTILDNVFNLPWDLIPSIHPRNLLT